MKKEHWLYVAIAILAIWIIASYMSKGSNNSNNYNDTGSTTSQTSAVVNTTNGSGSATEVPVVTSDSANPAVGVSVSTNANVPSIITPMSVSTGNADTNSVSVSNQSAGSMVALGNVSMTQNGWVVVHEADASGNPGWILGAQRFDAGTYTSGQVELLRGTVSSKTYFVMIHNDNGDKMFDFHTDTPVTTDGTAVMTSFVAQ